MNYQHPDLFPQISPTAEHDSATKVASNPAATPQCPQHASDSCANPSRTDKSRKDDVAKPCPAIKRAAKKASQRTDHDPGRERFLRRPEVQHVTGLSRSSLYRLITANEFPSPINLSKNAVAWLSSSIEAWMAARVAAAQLEQSSKRKER